MSIEQRLEDEVEDVSEEGYIIPSDYKITWNKKDYTVDTLFSRIKSGTIFIPPFQRGYVWTIVQASQFVESLLLGLPVPGIFLARETETERSLVIDGQQRLLSLAYFCAGSFDPKLVKERDVLPSPLLGKKFELKDVQKRFEGHTYGSLSASDRTRLDDAVLHATIVDQSSSSNDSIYYIFKRLNTGGVQLQSQEIRAAIYRGELNDLLRSLNKNLDWRFIYGKESLRMKDQELILRFFAFYYNFDKYKKPLMNFLNEYMKENRHLKVQSSEELSRIFIETIGFINHCLQKEAFRPKKQLNAAVFDAVMVGVARRMQRGRIKNIQVLRKKYKALVTDPTFTAAIFARSSDEGVVKIRIDLATKTFADIE